MIEYDFALRARHQDLLREAEQARRVRQLAPRPRRRPRRFGRWAGQAMTPIAEPIGYLSASAPRPVNATGAR